MFSNRRTEIIQHGSSVVKSITNPGPLIFGDTQYFHILGRNRSLIVFTIGCGPASAPAITEADSGGNREEGHDNEDEPENDEL